MISCLMTVVMFADNHQRRYAASLVSLTRRLSTSACSTSVLFATSQHTVCDWIASNKLRLAAVVETWHDSGECPDLIACTPPDYSFIERARPRSDENETSVRTNHGGVCLFYHSSLTAKRITFIDYLTFEYVCTYISGTSLTILAIVIYRPGSAYPSELFFEELADLFERSATYSASLVIAGDINIHTDVTSDPSTCKLT